MTWRHPVTAAVAAALMLGMSAAPTAAAGPPEVFEDPFAFTGPDFTNGVAVFVNTSRESFCTEEQVSRELAIIEWLDAGMVDPFPEWALERPAGLLTWTPQVIDTPRGVVAHLRESDQYIELWWLDDPEDASGVGACLDTDDRSEMFGAGTATIKATATDLFGSGQRPVAVDHFQGTADLVGVDGLSYRYSFFWHQLLPCEEPPGRLCEKARFALSQP